MRTALLLMTVVVASSCDLSVPFECDEAEFATGMTCDGVLAAAGAELAALPAIRTLTAVRGIHCPDDDVSCPNAPVVTVYADLADGRQVYVSVALGRDGTLTARPAEDVEGHP
jgi:hypothetical protein